jgi:hypothetical protein
LPLLGNRPASGASVRSAFGAVLEAPEGQRWSLPREVDSLLRYRGAAASIEQRQPSRGIVEPADARRRDQAGPSKTLHRAAERPRVHVIQTGNPPPGPVPLIVQWNPETLRRPPRACQRISAARWQVIARIVTVPSLYPRTCAQCFEYASAPAGRIVSPNTATKIARTFAPVRLNPIARTP